MGYRDWSADDKESFDQVATQNIFSQIDSSDLSDEQYEEAQELFEAGWLTFGEYSKDQLDAIRGDFLDIMGLTEQMFTDFGYWEEYRDLYSEMG